jgi:hypothetical protein
MLRRAYAVFSVAALVTGGLIFYAHYTEKEAKQVKY